MHLYSVNPTTGERIASHLVHRDAEAAHILEASANFQLSWSKRTPEQRADVLRRLAGLLSAQQDELALLMAREMGKPLKQGREEIAKCAWCCSWYADQIEELLEPREVATDAAYSAAVPEPLGVWLAIMPWNYPFWQVMRCLAPAAALGNTVILKHSSLVTGCALALARLTAEASGGSLLEVLVMPADRIADIIPNRHIKGISFTGGETAGRRVAAMAGAHLRPTVLELGGSNALIVLRDADLDLAARDAAASRYQNSGQSCIAAKRILVERHIETEFMRRFLAHVEALRKGSPEDPDTDLGPLASASRCEEVHDQVLRSIAAGAQCLMGGQYHGAFYEPTVLSGATPSMPCMQEEVFGPVASIATFTTTREAIEMSNDSRFGLGVSIYTQGVDDVRKMISGFHEGAVFVNAPVKSDPRLPFGGIKASGFGRELAREGLLAMSNLKTVYIRS